MSEQRDELIKALIKLHMDQRRRESDREAAAHQRGRLLHQAELEMPLPADVPLHKRGFGVMDEPPA